MDPEFVDAKLYQGYMYRYTDSDKALALYEEANNLAVKLKDKPAILNAKKSMGVFMLKEWTKIRLWAW